MKLFVILSITRELAHDMAASLVSGYAKAEARRTNPKKR